MSSCSRFCKLYRMSGIKTRKIASNYVHVSQYKTPHLVFYLKLQNSKKNQNLYAKWCVDNSQFVLCSSCWGQYRLTQRTDSFVCLCKGGWMEERTRGQKDERTNEWMNEWMIDHHLCDDELGHTFHYTKCIAGKLFNYPLKLITQYKGLSHPLLKTPNRKVLPNTSRKACQIKSAIYLPTQSLRNVTVPDFKNCLISIQCK